VPACTSGDTCGGGAQKEEKEGIQPISTHPRPSPAHPRPKKKKKKKKTRKKTKKERLTEIPIWKRGQARRDLYQPKSEKGCKGGLGQITPSYQIVGGQKRL